MKHLNSVKKLSEKTIFSCEIDHNISKLSQYMKKNLLASIAGIYLALSATALDMDSIYINGFISQGYLKTSENNYLSNSEEGSWEFNEIALSVKAVMSDNMSAGLQFFSRDLGDTGNNEVVLDWAFLDYRMTDSMGIRIGQFKKPMGFYNTVRDADITRTAILLPQSVYDEGLRSVQLAVRGIGLYGIIEMGGLGYLDYMAYVGDQTANLNEPLMKDTVLNTFYGIEKGGNWTYDWSSGVQLVWNTPLDGFSIGGTVGFAKSKITGTNTLYDFADEEIHGSFDDEMQLVISAKYQLNKWQFVTEYMVYNFSFGASPLLGDYHSSRVSTYVMVEYEISEKFNLGAYYDTIEEDQGFLGISERDDLALSLRYNVNEWWSVKSEVHFFDGTWGANPGADGNTAEEWMLFALKSTVSF